jgi:antitoxin VapB
MALNIRDPEVHDLARAIADATGETMTQAVKRALVERLARVEGETKAVRSRRFERLMAHAKRFRELPVLDPRPLDEMIDYDEHGLPR